MRIAASLQLFLLLAVGTSAAFGQKEDKIQISPLIVADAGVHKCKTLDVGSAAISVPPNYPTEAKTARIGGIVKVKLQIDPQGNVREITGIDGPPLLQGTAADAASKIKFTPTLCDGVAKSIEGLVTYNFRPFVFTESYFVAESIEEYSDIGPESNYYEPIVDLTENYKLAFGLKDKKFHPDSPITKGEFAHFLRTTLDLLTRRAQLANRDVKEIELFSPFNFYKIKATEEIIDFRNDTPFAESESLLLSKYDIVFINKVKEFEGKLPLTQNEVIEYWAQIFGDDAVPVNFERIKDGDRIFSRGEFALFLQESLNVLTYKVLP